ncbi:hypothetical protein [Streptomyces sp. NPDC093261]|uniref:hypothetical protein n=1 Tax=Streptomyces sp. NPDC093261 TaxID=3366037 RepID=UPI00382608AA
MNSTITAPVPVPDGRWAAGYTAAFRALAVQAFAVLPGVFTAGEVTAAGAAGTPVPEAPGAVPEPPGAAEPGAPDDATVLDTFEDALDGAPDAGPAAFGPPPGWHAVTSSAVATAAVASAALR